MEIGKLNKRITFQNFTMTENEAGFPIQAWADYTTVWASARNLSGREYFAAAAVQQEKTVEFEIRFRADIDATMRITFRGQSYDIKFPDNIDYSDKFLKIKALAVL